jgi:hypothetical protein
VTFKQHDRLVLIEQEAAWRVGAVRGQILFGRGQWDDAGPLQYSGLQGWVLRPRSSDAILGPEDEARVKQVRGLRLVHGEEIDQE